MAQRERFLEQPVAEALKRQQTELRPFWRDYARPVNVAFPAANVPRQVAHQLGTVPSGYVIVLATGDLFALTPEKWTGTMAILTAPVANTRAVLMFYTLREDPIDV